MGSFLFKGASVSLQGKPVSIQVNVPRNLGFSNNTTKEWPIDTSFELLYSNQKQILDFFRTAETDQGMVCQLPLTISLLEAANENKSGSFNRRRRLPRHQQYNSLARKYGYG
jgi:hypothetical protein